MESYQTTPQVSTVENQSSIQKFSAKLSELKCEEDITSLSADLQSDFKYFNTITDKLSTAVQIADSKDRVDSNLYWDSKRLDREYKKQEKESESEFLKRQKKLDACNTQLDALHDKLLETQNELVLGSLTRIVKDNELHVGYEEAIEELKDDIAAECCCFRFFSCCDSEKVRQARADIHKLKLERDKLDSEDPKVVYAAAKAAIDMKRKKIEKEEAAIASTKPKEVDEDARSKALNAEAKVDLEERQIRDKEIMALVLLTYEWYCIILNKLKRLPVENENTPLLGVKEKIKKAFKDQQGFIEHLFNGFWYLNTENKGRVLHAKFTQLGQEERQSYLKPSAHSNVADVIEKFVPSISDLIDIELSDQATASHSPRLSGAH